MQKIDLSQPNIERLVNDAMRYRAIRTLGRMSPESQEEFFNNHDFYLSHAISDEEFDRQTDALLAAIGFALADQIHAPAVMQELDPTHAQGCCGKCAGNCPPEAGWGPSDKAD